MKSLPIDIYRLLQTFIFPPDTTEYSKSYLNTMNKFIKDGIIEKRINSEIFGITEKGKKYIEMLCETPYPEKIYIDPRIKE